MTATCPVKFTSLQDVTAVLLEKELSSVLGESRNNPVVAQIRNERAHIIQAVMVKQQVKMWVEV
jgi:hypothetical protein